VLVVVGGNRRRREGGGGRGWSNLGTSLAHFRKPFLKEISFGFWHCGNASRGLPFRAVKSGLRLASSKITIRIYLLGELVGLGQCDTCSTTAKKKFIYRIDSIFIYTKKQFVT
jgi:hypothetical protein